MQQQVCVNVTPCPWLGVSVPWLGQERSRGVCKAQSILLYAEREREGGLEKNRVKDGEKVWEGTREGRG